MTAREKTTIRLHDALGEAGKELKSDIIETSGLLTAQVGMGEGWKQCMTCGHVHTGDVCPRCGTEAEFTLESKDFHGWWSDGGLPSANSVNQKFVAVYDSVQDGEDTHLVERMFLVTCEHIRETQVDGKMTFKPDVSVLEVYQNWECKGRRTVMSVPTKMFPNWCKSPFSRYTDKPMKIKHPIRNGCYGYVYTHEWWDFEPDKRISLVGDNPWNHYEDPDKF